MSPTTEVLGIVSENNGDADGRKVQPTGGHDAFRLFKVQRFHR
jgi:hypothetical protein